MNGIGIYRHLKKDSACPVFFYRQQRGEPGHSTHRTASVHRRWNSSPTTGGEWGQWI